MDPTAGEGEQTRAALGVITRRLLGARATLTACCAGGTARVVVWGGGLGVLLRVI